MANENLFDVRVWASYTATHEENRRAQEIIESFDHDSLIEVCKEVRGDGDIACAIQPHWSMGTRNLILEARFSDGVRWVLKVNMLASKAPNESFTSNDPSPTSDNKSAKISHESLCSSNPGLTSNNKGEIVEISNESFCSNISGSTTDDPNEIVEISNKLLHTSISDSTSGDGNEIFEIFLREFEAMEFIRSNTKLPVPTPHFIVRLRTTLGTTACLAMDLVQGVTGAFIFDRQHDTKNSNVQETIRRAQHRVLLAMADIQITLAQFQVPFGGYLRSSPHAEYKCFKVDNFGTHSPVESFGVGGDPISRTPFECYTKMIAKRARRLSTSSDQEYTSSAHEILSIIEDNIPFCCSNQRCFYLTNVDLSAQNAIFDAHGSLQAIIDVDALRFVPIEYAVQMPAGLGLEFFPDSASTVWRADNKSRLRHMEEYGLFLFAAGANCEQYRLGNYFLRQLAEDSAALIQGLEVVDGQDAVYNDEWLRSESVLRFMGWKSVADSSSSLESAV